LSSAPGAMSATRTLGARSAITAAITSAMLAPSSPRWKPSVSASDGWVCVASRWLVRTVARETKIASPSAAPSWKEAVISDAASPALSAGTPPLAAF